MADYYPLLARAVTGLQTSTPGARKAIYDRARGALLGQLRGIQPPLPEQDIERESDALEAAVQRLEDELAVAASVQARRTRRTGARPPPLGDEDAPHRGESAPEGQRKSGSGEDERSDASFPRGLQHSARAGRQRIEPTHPAAPTPPILRESKARFWIVGFTIVAVVAIIGVTAYFMRDQPEDLARQTTPPAAADQTPGSSKIAARIGPAPEARAPATVPLPSVRVATIPIQVPKSSEAGASQDKGSTRPSAPAAPGTPPGTAQTPKTSAAPAAPAAPATGAPNPRPVSPPSSPPQPAPQNHAAAAAAPGLPPAELPVTYRAALLLQAPDTPEKVKTFVGTVVWRTENVSGEPGQPLGLAVTADLDIPDAKFKVSVVLQKNTDAALSASHTMTLHFLMGPNSPVKGVRSISMPQMRADGAPSGEDLAGIGIVPITPTYYLVGLKQDPASVERDLDLLTGRNWIDVQFVLGDGRAAKITFEKGAQGGKLVVAAVEAWK